MTKTEMLIFTMGAMAFKLFRLVYRSSERPRNVGLPLCYLHRIIVLLFIYFFS